MRSGGSLSGCARCDFGQRRGGGQLVDPQPGPRAAPRRPHDRPHEGADLAPRRFPGRLHKNATRLAKEQCTTDAGGPWRQPRRAIPAGPMRVQIRGLRPHLLNRLAENNKLEMLGGRPLEIIKLGAEQAQECEYHG